MPFNTQDWIKLFMFFMLRWTLFFIIIILCHDFEHSHLFCYYCARAKISRQIQSEGVLSHNCLVFQTIVWLCNKKHFSPLCRSQLDLYEHLFIFFSLALLDECGGVTGSAFIWLKVVIRPRGEGRILLITIQISHLLPTTGLFVAHFCQTQFSHVFFFVIDCERRD